MSNMKKTIANWHLELTAYCPYCKDFQGDILRDIEETFENVPGKNKDLEIEVECNNPQFGKIFLFEETEYEI